MTQHIELLNPVLGLDPYVLLVFTDGGADDPDLTIKLNAGGGITTKSDIRAALTMALESLDEGAAEGEQP
jgi:hypothetical protein